MSSLSAGILTKAPAPSGFSSAMDTFVRVRDLLRVSEILEEPDAGPLPETVFDVLERVLDGYEIPAPDETEQSVACLRGALAWLLHGVSSSRTRDRADRLLAEPVLRMANTGALESAQPYVADDVFDVLVCTVGHSGAVHYGVALNLHGPEAGTVWALWRDDADPCVAVVLPDCPARSDSGDACSEFARHAGGHSWDLADRLRPGTAFPLPPSPSPG